MRWWFVALTLAGIVLALLTHAPGWFALGVAVAVICALAAALGFVQERIAQSSRAEELDDAEIDRLRRAVHGPAARAGRDDAVSPPASHDDA